MVSFDIAKNEFIISKVVIKSSSLNQPICLRKNWSIRSLSIDYPVYAESGYDELLEMIEGEYRDTASLLFYDNEGNLLSYDPRIFYEDIQADIEGEISELSYTLSALRI